MDVLRIDLPKITKNKTDDIKLMFAHEIAQTLTTGSSPISKSGSTLWIPKKVDISHSMIVNKQFLLSPLGDYITQVKETIYERYEHTILSSTLREEIIAIFDFLIGAREVKKENKQPGGAEVGSTGREKGKGSFESISEDFSNSEYVVNSLLPTIFPQVRWSLDSQDNSICIMFKTYNRKQDDKLLKGKFLQYILLKYNKPVTTTYNLVEQLERVLIYIKLSLRKKIRINGNLPGEYAQLKKYICMDTCVSPSGQHPSSTSVVIKKRKKNLSQTTQKKIFSEGRDDNHAFTEDLLREHGYSEQVYKNICATLGIGIDADVTVLEVAMMFYGLSDKDFYLLNQEKGSRIMLQMCNKIFSEYRVYSTKTHARWFIK